MVGLRLASRVLASIRSCPDCGYQFVVLSAGAPERGRRGGTSIVRGRVLLDHLGRYPVETCPACRCPSEVGNTIQGGRDIQDGLRRFRSADLHG